MIYFFQGIYFTFVMSLTSLSVLLAVVLLNVHLYGSALKPVPHRLRHILFFHLAPFLRVKLHRTAPRKDKKSTSCASTSRRSTTIYNAVFLNENDLSTNTHSHTLNSTTITETPAPSTNSDSDIRNPTSTPTMSNLNSKPQSLQECKRLLCELNRLILRTSESREEDSIIRDWQNVALVIDRCLFYAYLLLTISLTVCTLVLAPLLKTVPMPPPYFRLNMTGE